MDDRVLRIRKELQRTWPAFFGTFGRLLPIQVEVIPKILGGKNVVVSAPAAAGKTEGVMAPLLERILHRDVPEHGMLLLYIVPTRSLVNDIESRLKGIIRDLGLTMAVRTADRRLLKVDRPEHIVLTTPESFDSLLCRHKHLWDHLRAVVLDEIHLADNTYRGDQLRILLERLREKTGHRPIQYAALSATLSDPEAIANRYFQPASVVAAGEPRSLDLHLFHSWRDIIRFLKEKKWLKTIIFCNRRKDVENRYRKLSTLWPRDRIVVHHGSLSRALRLEAETALHQWEWGLCICTMTLEVGIDIGDFSAVVLDRPPLSLYAFQQRIGRACRREDRIEVVGYCKSTDEENLFLEYADLARSRIQQKDPYLPDTAVAVQQIFSMAFAHPEGVEGRFLEKMLSPLTDASTVQMLAAHLTDLAWLRKSRDRWQATEKLMDMGIRGLIHSNIPNEKEWTLIDGNSGNKIGTYPLAGAVPGDTVILGGACWKIVKMGGGKIYARRTAAGLKGAAFSRRASRSAFHRFLPPAYK